MRKVLFAGISAAALALTFGSTAWANPFEESTINLSGSSTLTNSLDKSIMGDNNKQSFLDIDTKVITKVSADQDIKQVNAKLHVEIKAIGGDGGNADGGNAYGGDSKGGKGGSGEEGGNASGTVLGSVQGGNGGNGGDGGNADDGGNASGGKGGKGGGGGGAAVATGNVTVGSFAFNAGVFNSAVSTGVVNNTNASTNIAALANNSFNK